MYIFGIDIPVLELLVIFCIIVVAYLFILELEFRQLRKIVKRFDQEELQFSAEMRELRNVISELGSAMKARKEK
jgi:hypothetical protein